jgi:hypothetical protein
VTPYPAPLASQGFLFSPDIVGAADFAVTGTQNAHFMGTTGIRLPDGDAIFVEREDGGVFDFSGLDIGAWSDVQSSVEICAVKDDGSVVTENIEVISLGHQRVWLAPTGDFSGIRKLRLPAQAGSSSAKAPLELDNLSVGNFSSAAGTVDLSGCDLSYTLARTHRIEGPNTDTYSWFGIYDIAADGDLVAVNYIGSSEDGYVVKVYKLLPDGNYNFIGDIPAAGNAIAVDGDLIAVANGYSHDGVAVKIYRFDPEQQALVWVQDIQDVVGRKAEDIDLKGGVLAVGTPGSLEQGAVTIYRAVSPARDAFAVEQVLTLEPLPELISFGFQVSLNDSGDLFVSHTPENVQEPTETRPVHIFRHNGSEWQLVQQIREADDGSFIMGFGSVLDSARDRLIVKADNGKAYLYARREGLYTLETSVTGIPGSYSDVAISEKYALYGFEQYSGFGMSSDLITGVVDVSDLMGEQPWAQVQTLPIRDWQVAAMGNQVLIGNPYSSYGSPGRVVDVYRLMAATSQNPDLDNDGMADSWELSHGFNPNDPSDAMGDLDNDRLLNREEFHNSTDPANADTDSDGIPDFDEVVLPLAPLDPNADTDGDGLTDAYEWVLQPDLSPQNSYDADSVDRDGDSLSELGEVTAGTDPEHWDSDGDGITDGEEVSMGLAPLNAAADSDGDGLSDAYEWALRPELSPANHYDAEALDRDGDGLSEVGELTAGTDPEHWDSDRDGITDGEEVSMGLAPLNATADSDGDGLSDTYEWALRPALSPDNSYDADSVDRDGDGLSEVGEVTAGTDPANWDSDGDGLTDGDEIDTGLSPLSKDTDGDQMPDGWEVQYGFNAASAANANADPDQDGKTNLNEFLNGTNPVQYDNTPPTANAGSDRTVPGRSTVVLDGSNSSDPYGAIVSYQWVQTGGTAVSLSAANSAQASFVAPRTKGTQSQVMTFRLTVFDAQGATATDTVVITAYR